MITASISTIVWREPGLARAVASVLPQVDRLNVFLQGYSSAPACLDDPRVTILRDTDAPESAALGASAKFHWLWHDLVDGYHFTVDDDIEYPPDYVRRCVDKIDEHGAIVGFHGMIYRRHVSSYFRDRRIWPFNKRCQSDQFVHALGTGTASWHTSTIRLTRADFAEANSCDLFLGLAAQRQRVPMLCLARPSGYLKALPLASDPRACAGPSDYETRMTRLHASIPSWKIHTRA
jgi:hypothetical protein